MNYFPSDKPQYHLMVNICKERHKPDKEFDTSINIDTEYVQLKLLSQKALGLVQRNEQEQRLDLYQNDMEALERSANINDLKDEDMIKDGDYEKYILIRGRAGIGKSTLLQRLLWKWANGEWATKFRAFFMLNLRHLTTIKTPVDLPYLLGNLNRYSSRESDNKPGLDWLKRNKRRICFVLGKYQPACTHTHTHTHKHTHTHTYTHKHTHTNTHTHTHIQTHTNTHIYTILLYRYSLL